MTPEQLQAAVLGFIAGARAKAVGGLTVAEFGSLFDAVADSCVPMLAKPVWWIVRPAVRTLVLSAAGGALEQILKLTREARPEPAA